MIPKDLLESKDSRKTIRAKAFVAWAGSQWKYPAPLDFIAYDLEGADLAGTSMWVSHTYWEDLRWDLETSKGSSAPRDMIVGFQYLSSTPYFKEKGQEAIDRLANVEWKGNPDLLTLKQLKARDTVREGMWIVCVRLPRAVGARHIVPFNRRKDVLGSLMEMVHGGDREKNATDKLAEIKTQIEKEEHPLDGPLRKLPDGTLICKVAAHITCSTCGATGHHMTHTHDDMTMQTQEGVKLYTQDIPWLVVKDLEAEVLPLPNVIQGGFDVEIRKVTAKIPLRLARAMKLKMEDVKGHVHACGVSNVFIDKKIDFQKEHDCLQAMLRSL